MEKNVVLSRGYRDFQDVANKVGHDSTAAATLRIQMCDVGYGHVVGKVESVIPIEVSIKDGGTEALGIVLPPIAIYLFDAVKELLSLSKQITIMVEVLNVSFELSFAHLSQQ